MKKLLMFAGAALLMTACSESPTAPSAARRSAPEKVSADLTCRSGYIIAYDENGDPYCAPAQNTSAARPRP